MPAPDPALTFDPVSSQIQLQAANSAFQTMINSHTHVMDLMRMSMSRSVNFADAMATRIVEESGSGRVRNIDGTVAGQAASGK